MDDNWNKKRFKLNKCSIIWIKWHKMRKKQDDQNKKTYNWKSVAYNWNTSEIMSVKLIKNSDKWNKMI